MSKVVRAHTNIALIKYWGKKDKELKIPSNSSVSLTLDKFYTDTRVVYDPTLKEDVFYLDDILVDDKVAKRVKDYMNVLRKYVDIPSYAKIESWNHVPKEAGLASSASAFAALAKAATLHLGLSDAEVSKLARLGSGSASRSIYPNFVRWERGFDHGSSVAAPIEMKEWDDVRMVVCLVNDAIKPYPSSEAMDVTSKVSPYFEAWTKESERDSVDIVDKIQNHDIWEVGKMMQVNTLKMHASLYAANMWYLEPKTVEIMNCVRELQKNIPVFFTMDAGPNVKIITTHEYIDLLIAALPKDIESIVCGPGKGTYVL